MSQVRVTEAFLDAIADAIRAKLGVTDTYKPSEMAEAILEISGGGGDMSIIANEYSSSATYAEGDYCIHVGTLCKCITAISTPEEWNVNHWGATDVATELNRRLKPSDVVNNLTSTDPTKVLGAPQGKALNDQIAQYIQINSSASNSHSQSDVINWITQHDSEYRALRSYYAEINYSGWGICYGYAIKISSGHFMFDVMYEAGGRNLRFVIKNGALVYNRYVDYTNET